MLYEVGMKKRESPSNKMKHMSNQNNKFQIIDSFMQAKDVNEEIIQVRFTAQEEEKKESMQERNDEKDSDQEQITFEEFCFLMELKPSAKRITKTDPKNTSSGSISTNTTSGKSNN